MNNQNALSDFPSSAVTHSFLKIELILVTLFENIEHLLQGLFIVDADVILGLVVDGLDLEDHHFVLLLFLTLDGQQDDILVIVILDDVEELEILLMTEIIL